MDIDLELFQGADHQYYGELPLDGVLRKAAVGHFGDLARRGRIHLSLEEPGDPEPYPGPPEVHNLERQHGYCILKVIRDGQTVGEERLRIVELLGPVLAGRLRELEPG